MISCTLYGLHITKKILKISFLKDWTKLSQKLVWGNGKGEAPESVRSLKL